MDTFWAGLGSGWWVFGERNAVSVVCWVGDGSEERAGGRRGRGEGWKMGYDGYLEVGKSQVKFEK